MDFRNKIDVDQALLTSGLNLGNERMEIKSRLEDLKTNPYDLKQIAGCCGFNVIVTLLLIHGDTDVFANLLKLVWGSQINKPGGLVGFEQAKGKLEAFYSKNPKVILQIPIVASRESTDFKRVDTLLILALMGYFNRYCKRHNSQLWTDCAEYSEAWGWEKGKKIKEVLQGESQLTYSYKKGDFALTPIAILTLLNCFGATFSWTKKGPCNNQTDSSKAVREAREWARSWGTADKGKYIIAAVYVSSDPRNTITQAWNELNTNIQNKDNKTIKTAAYDYVNHWVTIPRVDKDSDSKLMATWGEKIERNHIVIKNVYCVTYQRISPCIPT